MLLKDNLYTIVSQENPEGIPAFRIRINPEWPIYQAHFPGHPVTPGVCIVQMVQELLQVHLDSNLGQNQPKRRLQLWKAKNVKYLAIVSPEEVTHLTVAFPKIEPQPDGSLKVQAQVLNSDTLCTKLSATFRYEEPR